LTRQTRYNIEVAVAVLIGIAALIGIGLYLRGVYSSAKTYAFSVDFKNARGVTTGAAVQMAGVQIGRVESVNLTPENVARLRLRVDGKYPIPNKARFTIATGLLASTAIVNVDPAPGGSQIVDNEPKLTGTDAPNIDTAVAQGQEILMSATKITRVLEKLITSPQNQRDLERTRESLARTTQNLARASESLPRLVRSVEQQEVSLARQAQELAADLRAAGASAPRIARNIEGLSGDVRGVLSENRASLREAADNIAGTTSAIRGLTDQINDEIKTGNLKQNLAATSDNLRSISQRFDAIAANFERLSGDPRLTADLRETLTNVRDTSASVRNLASRIETIRIPGERRPRATSGGTPAPPPAPRPAPSSLLTEPGIVLDSVFDTNAERVRLDANFTLLGAQGRFYRAGIFDLTERNRLNLQLGQPVLGGRSALRYGLIRGKLGGGLDTRVGPLFVRADLYDPNRLTLDLRARARVSDTTSALFGLESAGSDNRATIGVQISR